MEYDHRSHFFFVFAVEFAYLQFMQCTHGLPITTATYVVHAHIFTPLFHYIVFNHFLFAGTLQHRCVEKHVRARTS